MCVGQWDTELHSRGTPGKQLLPVQEEGTGPRGTEAPQKEAEG